MLVLVPLALVVSIFADESWHKGYGTVYLSCDFMVTLKSLYFKIFMAIYKLEKMYFLLLDSWLFQILITKVSTYLVV